MRVHSIALILTSCFLFACGPSPLERIQASSLPSRGNTLWPDAHIQSKQLKELSGLARASRGEWLWAHNDSGDQARIFAVADDGSVLGRKRGIPIVGAHHIDWEDVATDGAGRLFIGDFGNNKSTRHVLQIYVLQEPDPESVEALVTSVLHFQLPEAERSKAAQNDDIEALFYKDAYLYFFTKHRSDKSTRLFRLDPSQAHRTQIAQKVGEFAINGQVTAADYWPEKQRLAVLTYNKICIFDASSIDEQLFARQLNAIPYRARQCEAVVFLDSDTLLMGNEQRELFTLPTQ